MKFSLNSLKEKRDKYRASRDSVRNFLTDKVENDIIHNSEEEAERMKKHFEDTSHEHSHRHTEGFVGMTKRELMILGGRLAAAILLLIFASLPSIGGDSKLAVYVFSIAAFFLAGYDIIFKAIRCVIEKRFFNETILMTVAAIGALIIGECHESVLIMVLSQIGEFLQDYAVGKSRKSIESLLDMRPDTVNLLISNKLKQVPAEDVNIGDIFLVYPGDRIPLDGKLLVGTSELDMSALTGESFPQSVSPGDEILSGSINMTNALTIKATAKLKDSTVWRILDLVENAEESKGESEKFITKFAGIYTPIVFGVALVVAFIIPLIFSQPLAEWVHRALVLLVISCPCALIISVPLTYFAGIGGASKNGVLIKGADVIDSLANVTSAVFDKTGTLTTGEFEIISVDPVGISREELLMLAAYAESMSTHPIAKSIVRQAGVKINRGKITGSHEEPGKGVVVQLDHKLIVSAGNAAFMNELQQDISFDTDDTAKLYVALERRYVGSITLSDTVKKDSVGAIYALNKLGVDRIIMLTGDKNTIAKETADALGISEVYSQCLPEDKAEKVLTLREMQIKGETLAYIGDGINDVPVLTMADVGISMGGLGSDAAIEASDVVIITDEPSKIPGVIAASKNTREIVKQNVIMSLGVKVLIFILALLGWASMWLAVIADVGIALVAIINAMRAFSSEKYELNTKISQNKVKRI